MVFLGREAGRMAAWFVIGGTRTPNCSELDIEPRTARNSTRIRGDYCIARHFRVATAGSTHPSLPAPKGT